MRNLSFTPRHSQVAFPPRTPRFNRACQTNFANIGQAGSNPIKSNEVNFERTATSPPPHLSIQFASEDFCADLGATRTSGAEELLYARSAVVTHAVSYGLQAIDMVCIQFKDNEQLVRECTQGFNLGFTGKQVRPPGVELS